MVDFVDDCICRVHCFLDLLYIYAFNKDEWSIPIKRTSRAGF